MLQEQQFNRPTCFPFPHKQLTNSSVQYKQIQTPTLGQIPKPSVFDNIKANRSQMLQHSYVTQKSPIKTINIDEQSTKKKKQSTYLPIINDGLMLRKRSKFQTHRNNKQTNIIPKDYIFRRISTQPDNSLAYYLKKSKQKQRQFTKQKQSRVKTKQILTRKQKRLQKMPFSLQQIKKPSICTRQQINQQQKYSKITFTSLKTQYSHKRQYLIDIFTQNRKATRILGKSQVRIPSIPHKSQLSSFLVNYKTINQQIDLHQLLKANFCAIQYSGQQLYIGQMIGKHKNGKGIFINPKSCFQGQWKNNNKVKGVQVTHKGVYKGTYLNNKKDGNGQYHRHSGDIYIGQWKNGKQHGTGLWVSDLGDTYNGSWSNGKIEGMGALSLKKRHYKGWFVNFRQSGFGKQTFGNGDNFQGIFKDDLPNGKGIYRWKDGSIFQGMFVDGKREGWGQLKVNSQVIYCGQFRGDKPQGQCQIFMKNRPIWRGLAKRGQSKSVNIDRSRQNIRDSLSLLGSGVDGVYRI